MSRSRLPPTPAMSGELIVKERSSFDGVDSFSLPPAAISPSKPESASRRSSKSDPSIFCPASPTSPDLAPGRNPLPPRQATLKRPLEDFDLPPPPTRSRKIIQMKPKTQSSPKPSSKDTPNTKGSANNNASAAPSKKKQPSATSAAGRKIARKTAHSLIERRRRSKMNEEFTTLKDMIPACKGHDMHKLAILQASIEYVNYLEKCIQDLKTAGDSQHDAMPSRMPPGPPSPASPEVLEGVAGSIYSASASPDLAPDGRQAAVTSPAFSPRSHAIEPTPSILPSPALGPSYPRDVSSWALPSSANTSPVLQPEYRKGSSADMDHEASAALLMLNRECRRSIGSVEEPSVSAGSLESPPSAFTEPRRQSRMSVKDLLIS
ncbi:hypothetical protein BDV59DRAFT_21869 [Aspergillus ambiguus]|uniref:uncharacterized protein n=1 Tax=Aspergillus ambiguus TaxID=176160 RepID=UPI003CCCFBFF